MKAIAQKLVIGLLAIAVTCCVVGVVQAAPPPHPWIPGYPTPSWLHGPHYGPHYGPHPGPWIPPVVIYRPRPYIVERVGTSYCLDDSNPTPTADIRLVNPAENRVTLKYTLNGGEVQMLQAGYSAQLNQAAVIEYDRGGNAGRTRYSLTDGTYNFKPTNGGYWGLFHEDATSNVAENLGDVAANPLPGK
jgi:hypothetical protein